MATRNKSSLMKEYQTKADEILLMASSLPKLYQEKVLKDLQQLNQSSDGDSSVDCQTQVRRSSRTPVKTAKLLALEKPEKNKNYPSVKTSKLLPLEKSEKNTNDTPVKTAKLPLPEKSDKNKSSRSTKKSTTRHKNTIGKVKKESRENEALELMNVVKIENPDLMEELPEPSESGEVSEKEGQTNSCEMMETISMQAVSEKEGQTNSCEMIETISMDTVSEKEGQTNSCEMMEIISMDKVQAPDDEDIKQTLTGIVESTEPPVVMDNNKLPEEKMPSGIPARRRRPKKNAVLSEYVCPECNQIMPTRDSLRLHLSTHKSSYKCEVCGQKFAYKHAFDKHVEIHENGDFHKCPHCANMIKGKDRLEKHIQAKHEDVPTCTKKYHTCFQCNERFRSTKKLMTHQLNEHGKNVQICPICARRFLYKGHYDKHLEDHAADKYTKCQYEKCTFYYKTEKEAKNHLARVHDKNAPRPHMCHICSRSFCEQRYLKAHLKSHKRDKKFVCETCMFETYTIESLKNHLKRKHSMTLAHVCELCGAKLSSKVSLEDHMKRHYNQRDYMCDVCSKGFVSRSQLSAHKKIHGNRPYVCNECNKSFINKFKLASHMRVHTEEKQFSCTMCKYCCNLKTNLYKHMERIHRTQHPDKFSSYKYVERVDTDIDGGQPAPTETILEIIDIPNKPHQEGDQVAEEPMEYLETEGYTEVIEQTEAAHVLAQMQQSGQIVIKQEGVQYSEEEILEDTVKQEIPIDNSIIENVLHVEEAVQYEDSKDTMYVLQVEGPDGTTVIQDDLTTLNVANIITVESGTVLLDNTGAVMNIIS